MWMQFWCQATGLTLLTIIRKMIIKRLTFFNPFSRFKDVVISKEGSCSCTYSDFNWLDNWVRFWEPKFCSSFARPVMVFGRRTLNLKHWSTYGSDIKVASRRDTSAIVMKFWKKEKQSKCNSLTSIFLMLALSVAL